MANPFKRKKHTTLGAGLVIGSLVGGVAAYLFYSKNGSDVRDRLAGKIDELRLKFFSKKPEETPEVAQSHSYMEHPKKAPKTDREALLKHEVLSSDQPNTNQNEG